LQGFPQEALFLFASLQKMLTRIALSPVCRYATARCANKSTR